MDYSKWNRLYPHVPFIGDDMQSWVSYGFPGNRHPDGRWVHLNEFSGEFELVNYTHGRSSVQITLRDCITGLTYPISLADWFELVKKHAWIDGRCQSVLTFKTAKKGANYFIVPVEETE